MHSTNHDSLPLSQRKVHDVDAYVKTVASNANISAAKSTSSQKNSDFPPLPVLSQQPQLLTQPLKITANPASTPGRHTARHPLAELLQQPSDLFTRTLLGPLTTFFEKMQQSQVSLLEVLETPLPQTVAKISQCQKARTPNDAPQQAQPELTPEGIDLIVSKLAPKIASALLMYSSKDYLLQRQKQAQTEVGEVEQGPESNKSNKQRKRKDQAKISEDELFRLNISDVLLRWRSLSKDEKAKWETFAKSEKLRLERLYPNWKEQIDFEKVTDPVPRAYITPPSTPSSANSDDVIFVQSRSSEEVAQNKTKTRKRPADSSSDPDQRKKLRTAIMDINNNTPVAETPKPTALSTPAKQPTLTVTATPSPKPSPGKASRLPNPPPPPSAENLPANHSSVNTLLGLPPGSNPFPNIAPGTQIPPTLLLHAFGQNSQFIDDVDCSPPTIFNPKNTFSAWAKSVSPAQLGKLKNAETFFPILAKYTKRYSPSPPVSSSSTTSSSSSSSFTTTTTTTTTASASRVEEIPSENTAHEAEQNAENYAEDDYAYGQEEPEGGEDNYQQDWQEGGGEEGQEGGGVEAGEDVEATTNPAATADSIPTEENGTQPEEFAENEALGEDEMGEDYAADEMGEDYAEEEEINPEEYDSYY